jgi:hypothetical protein
VKKTPREPTQKRPRGTSARAQFDAFAAKYLESYRRRFEKGDAEALLEAVDWILMYEAKPPDWVRAHFTRNFGAFQLRAARTLDEAFGIKREDERVFKTQRKRMLLVQPITFRLAELHREGHSLTAIDAYGQVAEEFGITVREVIACWGRGKTLLNRKVR